MRLLLAAGALLAVDLSLALFLPERAAGAGTAVRLDLSTLVQRSELIVEARVLAAHALEERDLLLTEYLLEVARTFKGDDRSYRVLRLPGGVRADGSGLVVPGVPGLVPGEEAVLFLEPEGKGGMRLFTGLAQGKLRLRRGADGTKRLERDVSALGLVGDAGQGGGARALVDYADLVAAIEAAARAPGAGR
jgi:hypothetical protein